MAKVFTPIGPSDADLARARALPQGACPRRYCWWWHSLSFDWDMAVRDGCTFMTSEKPPGYPVPDCPCKRVDKSSNIDHFEPREPHLIEDGMVPIWYFHID